MGRSITEPIRQVITASVQQQDEQRLGFTARRAAILAAVVCVLTLTIAGPVRTFFAQRTEMNQLAASEAALRTSIAMPILLAPCSRSRATKLSSSCGGRLSTQ